MEETAVSKIRTCMNSWGDTEIMAYMIKRIKKIQKYGIFKDFSSCSEVLDFNDKNIIYGWNYSGKTTLSRLFASLDSANPVSVDFPDAKYEIALYDTLNKITEKDGSVTGINIRVFNSDFINAKLKFGSSERIEGVAFDIGEGVEIREQIASNRRIIEKGLLISESHKSYTMAFKSFEEKFTNEAKRIKNDEFNSLIDFNKPGMKKVIESLSVPYEQYTNVDKRVFQEMKSNALSQGHLEPLNEPPPSIKFKELRKKTKEIIEASPQKDVEDDLLSRDNDFYEWAREGLGLYNEKEPRLVECAFCGNIISQERINFLNSFYTNEAARIKNCVIELLAEIDQEKNSIENLHWAVKSPNDLIDSLRQRFIELKKCYSESKSLYLIALDSLKEKLQEKLVDKLFTYMSIDDISENSDQILKEWIERVEEVFNSNDEQISRFSEIQKQAREEYMKYLVANFLTRENYIEILSRMRKEIRLRERVDRITNIYKEKNIELEKELKSFAKGSERLNDFIQILLNRNDIYIEVVDEDYFILKRGSENAKNLSEGEKTAIAFSYFMTQMESLFYEGKLTDTIVFIDDPVSSLDANHLAQVSSLINSFFFRKGIDPNNAGKVNNCFRQLFISTHNFDFYSYIRDANNIKRKKKNLTNGEANDVSACNLFMLKREELEKTILINMPKAFSKYNSEYVFLFSEIITYKEDGYREEKGYIMPNVVRRFLEIYTLTRLPGNTDEIDNRVKILVSDINELKILHSFSHFTSFERMKKHNEMMLRMGEIVEDILVLLEKDKTHLNSLYEGIGRTDLIN